MAMSVHLYGTARPLDWHPNQAKGIGNWNKLNSASLKQIGIGINIILPTP